MAWLARFSPGVMHPKHYEEIQMQKKLLAIAVAGAFAPAIAQAQTSTVQVYGNLYYEYTWMDQGTRSNGPGVNVDMMQTPGSEIGFKGEEKLGGGLSAWFQCASTADMRGQSQEGWCSRNSAVGLKGAFGNIFMGNWDTPFKRAAGINRIVNETGAFGASFLLTGGATTVNGGQTPGLFSRRQNNMVTYDSPNFGGFQVMAAVNATTASSAQTSGNATAKPRLWSLAGTYRNGPLNVALAYEQHKDFAPGTANSSDPYSPTVGGRSGTDKAWVLGAGYQLGTVRLGAMYIDRKYETPNSTDLKVSSWNLAADWKFAGPHGLRAGYTRANDTKNSFGTAAAPLTIAGSGSTIVGNGGTGGTGASLWQIHYVNTLSKRTEATIGYARLDNKNNARYTLGGLSSNSAGNDQHVWGLSLRHRF
jgi:predicted porin